MPCLIKFIIYSVFLDIQTLTDFIVSWILSSVINDKINKYNGVRSVVDEVSRYFTKVKVQITQSKTTINSPTLNMSLL